MSGRCEYWRERWFFSFLRVSQILAKMMSVLVRAEKDGAICLFAKGAEHVMFERFLSSEGQVIGMASQALEAFSKKGLRTLVYGGREVPVDEYEDFAKV